MHFRHNNRYATIFRIERFFDTLATGENVPKLIVSYEYSDSWDNGIVEIYPSSQYWNFFLVFSNYKSAELPKDIPDFETNVP